MSEFKKKPVKIQAIRYDGKWKTVEEIIKKFGMSRPLSWHPDGEPFLMISTLEGEMKANKGDWIIQGVHGEIYPCKDDIFRETYSPSGEDHCRYCKFDGEERRPCDAYERCCFEWKEDDIMSQNYNGGDL